MINQIVFHCLEYFLEKNYFHHGHSPFRKKEIRIAQRQTSNG